MNRQDAEERVKTEGFNVTRLIEEHEDFFAFECKRDDGWCVVVIVDNDGVLVAPT